MLNRYSPMLCNPTRAGRPELASRSSRASNVAPPGDSAGEVDQGAVERLVPPRGRPAGNTPFKIPPCSASSSTYTMSTMLCFPWSIIWVKNFAPSGPAGMKNRSENATVTLCHTGTRDLAAEVRQADIVVAAAGVPGIITADMVKPGAAVLDVGVSRIIAEDGHSKVAGDVADEVREVAGWVSPNPGGVGPMTRAMLLSNVVLAAERAAGLGAGSPA